MTTSPPAGLRELGAATGQLHSNGVTTVAGYDLGPGVADPGAWVAEHRDTLRGHLASCGAVVLSGLPVDLDLFSAVVRTVGGELLAYRERSTPRTEVGANIYTSTEYPPDQPIPMHNENSYSSHWPELLFFLCHTPAATGGATPVADSRAVLRRLDPAVRERFAGGVRYTRTFRDGLGLSWPEAFQTDSRDDVERYCRANGQDFRWTGTGLSTSHLQPAWRTEPATGAEVWFNQANLFHVSALDEEVREALEAVYAPDELPRNAYYGDGSAIPEADLAAVAAAYAATALALPWRAGSVLIINNMLVAHGREAFTGERRVLVAMS